MQTKVNTFIFIIIIFFIIPFSLVSCGADEEVGNEKIGFIYDSTVNNTDGICSSPTIDFKNNLILNDKATASVHDENTTVRCDDVNIDNWLIISTEDKLNWVSVWNGNILMYNQPIINLDESVTYCGEYTHVCVNPAFDVDWDIASSKDSVETIYYEIGPATVEEAVEE